MNVPFLVGNILSGVGMCAMLASTALRSRRKILAVQSVNHALSIAACSLLRGWSGAVQEAVNLVRDLAVLLFGRLNRFWQIFFVAAALGLGARAHACDEAARPQDEPDVDAASYWRTDPPGNDDSTDAFHTRR